MSFCSVRISRGPDAISGFPSPDTAQRIFTTGEGIEHQSRYLEEMNGRIRGDLAQLMERSGRLREEMRRYEHNRHRYRNKRFTDEQFAKRFGRAGRYHRLHDRYANMSSTVYVFDDYDRGSALGDFLWWDVMTTRLGLWRDSIDPQLELVVFTTSWRDAGTWSISEPSSAAVMSGPEMLNLYSTPS